MTTENLTFFYSTFKFQGSTDPSLSLLDHDSLYELKGLHKALPSTFKSPRLAKKLTVFTRFCVVTFQVSTDSNNLFYYFRFKFHTN